MNHNAIAIIPARGGSKRIPGKNIKSFLGKPIIAYSIEAALNSNLFDIVMVSTDDTEIAEISKHYGATVPFYRSNETATDHAGTVEVLLEVLEKYTHLKKQFEYGCCIYPCAPFITVPSLINAYQKMKDNGFDAVFPVVPYSTPVQRAFKFENNKLELFYPENLMVRSQDLQPAYFDSGQFYFFKTDSLIVKKRIVTDNSSAIIISDLQAQDIDNESDWKLAEIKYKLMFS